MASAKVASRAPPSQQQQQQNQQHDSIASAGRGEIISTRPYLPPPIDPTVIEKETYIPFEFAQSKVKEVSSDLHILKTGYEKYVEKLQSYHATIQAETRSHYENYILDLKKKALQRIEYEKAANIQLIKSLEEQIQAEEEKMVQLAQDNSERNLKYQNTIQNLNKTIAANEKSYQNDNQIRKECSQILNEVLISLEITSFQNYQQEMLRNNQSLLEHELTDKEELRSNLLRQQSLLQSNYEQEMELIHQKYHHQQQEESEINEIMRGMLHHLEKESWNRIENKIVILESQLTSTQLDAVTHEERLLSEHEEMVKKVTADYEEKMRVLQEKLTQLEEEYEELKRALDLHLKGEQENTLLANQLSTELHEKDLNILQLKGQVVKSVAQRNIEEVLSTVNQHEVNSQLMILNTQLNNLNNQLVLERTRNVELEQLVEQLKLEIAAGMRDVSEKERVYLENIDQFQLQMNELQLQLQQQKDLTTSQQQEIVLLKEAQSTPPPAAAVIAPAAPTPTSPAPAVEVNETLAGPPVNILQRQSSKLSTTEPSSSTSATSSASQSNELLQLLSRLEELKSQLQASLVTEEQSNELKLTTKNDIKKWMKEFEKANGRPPNNEEKSSVKEKFVAHKQANEAATRASSEVERIRTEITQIEEHIKLLQDSPPSAVGASDAASNPENGNSTAPPSSSSAAVDSNPQVSISSVELTQLNEKYQQLQELYSNLQQTHHNTEKEMTNLQIDNKDLMTRLESIRNEKRTDLVARLETEGDELREKLLQTNNEIILLKTEKIKNESKINELKERVNTAEKELKERDERDIQQTKDQETIALKTTVAKQRTDIVMKSQAATAGWDAAANAEEKLDVEIEKAYHKGITEGKKMNVIDLQSVHEAIEIKEQKIIELIDQCADADKRAMKAEKEMEDALQQLMVAQNFVEMIKQQQQQQQQQQQGSNGDGQNGLPMNVDMSMMSSSSAAAASASTAASTAAANDERIQELEDELEKSKERLDETQEEMVSLSEQVDELQQALDLSEQKIKLLQQMLSTVSTNGSVEAVVTTSASRNELKSDQNTFADSIVNQIRVTIEKGTKMWNDGKKDECYDLYDATLVEFQGKLKTSALKDPIGPALTSGRGQAKRRGAVVLRKALDSLLAAIEESSNRNAENLAHGDSSGTMTPITSAPLAATITSNGQMEALQKQLNSLNANPSNTLSSTTREGGGGNAMLLKQIKEANAEIVELKKQIASLERSGAGSIKGPMLKSVAGGGGGGGADPAEVKALQKKIKELETQLNGSGGGSGGGAAEKKAVAAVEKKYEKQAKELEKVTRKEKAALESRVTQLESDLSQFTTRCNEAEGERDQLRQRVKELSNATTEMETLRAKAAQVDELNAIIQENNQQITQLSAQYKKESQLRKQYKNELEDLKGAIRVYARVRPMAQYEIEKNCQKIVQFPDETSVKVQTSRGDKEFEFDSAFTDLATQEQVFEDTKRLVESFLDGFNVCLFAYGQTGSGKTWTMTGSESNPGLTPRAIHEMFRLIGERTHCTSRVTSYFIELYNDNLVDLYWLLDNRRARGEPPKLDIKQDPKTKMVFVKNAVIKDARSSEELLELFRLGNAERHVGATKMNAESSRSHSIFAVMVETYDSTTKKTVYGKLSLVDLAGSERADKTGAGAERLREAQSINKSLSALGDVISALSEGEKFIPYRNNKLTQLMQDSLGGNAKTLMFVNFSPADYNADETVTSLSYATRVKKITNNASKQAESEEIAKLKAQIRRLQGGGTIIEETEDNGGGGEEEEKS